MSLDLPHREGKDRRSACRHNLVDDEHINHLTFFSSGPHAMMAIVNHSVLSHLDWRIPCLPCPDKHTLEIKPGFEKVSSAR